MSDPITLTKTEGLPPPGEEGLFLGWLPTGRTVLLKWSASFGEPAWVGIGWDGDSPTSRPILYRVGPEAADMPPTVVITYHARLL